MSNYNKFVFGLFMFCSFYGNVSCQYCPVAADIAPYCNCTGTGSTTIVMDCSNVQTEDQLNEIFTIVRMPYPRMREFIIENNQALVLLSKNVFGSVSFQYITFRNTVIQYIDAQTFTNSKSYLLEWNMYSCNSLSIGFPFASLSAYTVLKTLHFESTSYFDIMPRVSSNTLTYLYIRDSQFGFIPVNTFYDVSKLTDLYLIGNNITSLPGGIFQNNIALKNIYIRRSNMDQISAGTFVNLTALESLYLGLNKMAYVEPDAFKNVPKLLDLSLTMNDLDYITIATLGNLPAVKSINVAFNKIQVYERTLFTDCPQLEKFIADNNQLAKVTINDFLGTPMLNELRLSMNEISAIEQGSFSNLNHGILDLNSNQLTTLDESWLRPVLESNNSVSMLRNPLACGCDIAWLYTVSSSALLNSVSALCANGTDIHDLNSAYFILNCPSLNVSRKERSE